MRRRDFIAGMAGSVTMPLAVLSQQWAVPVVGLLTTGINDRSPVYAGFRQGLSEQGYIDERNVQILYQYAQLDYDRLPNLAADLIGRGVSAIVAVGTVPALAAKAATAIIPIVFGVATDPIELGLVPSLNRPGGNITGAFTAAWC